MKHARAPIFANATGCCSLGQRSRAVLAKNPRLPRTRQATYSARRSDQTTREDVSRETLTNSRAGCRTVDDSRPTRETASDRPRDAPPLRFPRREHKATRHAPFGLPPRNADRPEAATTAPRPAHVHEQRASDSAPGTRSLPHPRAAQLQAASRSASRRVTAPHSP